MGNHGYRLYIRNVHIYIYMKVYKWEIMDIGYTLETYIYIYMRVYKWEIMDIGYTLETYIYIYIYMKVYKWEIMDIGYRVYIRNIYNIISMYMYMIKYTFW